MSVAVASVAAEPFGKLPALQAEVPKFTLKPAAIGSVSRYIAVVCQQIAGQDRTQCTDDTKLTTRGCCAWSAARQLLHCASAVVKCAVTGTVYKQVIGLVLFSTQPSSHVKVRMKTRAWLEHYIHGKTQPRYDKPRKSESYRKYTATLLHVPVCLLRGVSLL